MKPTVDWLEQKIFTHFPRIGRRLLALSLIVALAVSAVGLLLWPVAAAVQLQYFIVVPTQREITLQWATVAENALSGFEVQCKLEEELADAYHVIGEVPAEGGPQEGATYIFPITSGLQRGVTYCFRLREIALNGEPGDIFEACGYGLGIVPTPTIMLPLTDTAALRATESALSITSTVVAANQIATAVAAAQATVDALRATAAITVTPTLTGAAQLAPTLTAIAQISPTLTAIAILNSAPTFTPTPGGVITEPQGVELTLTAIWNEFAATQTTIANVNSGAPLETPTFTPTPTFDFTNQEPFSITLTVQSAQATETAVAVFGSGFAQDTPTPTATPIGASPLQFDPNTGLPLDPNTGLPIDPNTGLPFDPNLTLTPTLDPNLGFSTETPTPTATTTLTTSSAALPEPVDELALADETPSPGFMVVTATPPTPTTSPPPTLTPLPTPTNTPPGLALASLMAPTTQNLTLMLLCFTFFTASGLGILGLITSVIYMRSQRNRGDER